MPGIKSRNRRPGASREAEGTVRGSRPSRRKDWAQSRAANRFPRPVRRRSRMRMRQELARQSPPIWTWSSLLDASGLSPVADDVQPPRAPTLSRTAMRFPAAQDTDGFLGEANIVRRN
jgi:hypothetical protein